MPKLKEFVSEDGRRPFAEWFLTLSAAVAARVLANIDRVNFSNVKSVGAGVHEVKLDVGPGYRIYIGVDGDHLIILLGGGNKKRQQNDIAQAKTRWKNYKERKRKLLV
jgi:putative addiction module killer protein